MLRCFCPPARGKVQFTNASGLALGCLALVTAKCPRYIESVRLAPPHSVQIVIGNGALKMVESKEQALNLQNSEQVLISFHEWMVQQAHAVKSTNQATQLSDLENSASRKGSYFPPSIASEPSIKSSSSVSQEHPIDPSKQANVPPGASNRSPVERQVFRIICGLVIAIVFAVVWQAYRDDQTMKLVRAWGHSSVIWLSSALGAPQRESESAAEPSTKLSDQAASTPAVTPLPTKEFAELYQQLQTVVNDLAVLRRNVEQLSDRQEQMSRDILAVQATEQNVSEKVSSLTQAAPVHTPPRRSVPRLVHAETPRQPAPAFLPSQASAAGGASPTDQPPRPPLPLPTPTETPSPLH